MSQVSLRLCAYVSGDVSLEKYKMWKHTAEALGYKYNIIGREDRWGGIRDWSRRTKAYIQYLKSFSGNDVFIFTDSTDVIMLSSPQELLEKFQRLSQKLHAKVIIGGESLNYFPEPHKYQIEEHFTKKAEGRFRVPNGGMLIGYRQDLLECMEEIKEAKCDQTAYAIAILQGRITNMAVDSEGYIFANVPQLNRYTEFEIDFWIMKDKRLHGATGTVPCVVHTPGHKNCKQLKIWYDHIYHGKSCDKSIEDYSSGYYCTEVYNVITFFVVLLIFLVLIILLVWYLSGQRCRM